MIANGTCDCRNCAAGRTSTTLNLATPKLRIIEEKDKAAFVAGYRKGVLSLLKATADFEIALIDNDFDKAKKLAEEMDAVKKSSHEVYKKMPRKGGAGGEKGEKGK